MLKLSKRLLTIGSIVAIIFLATISAAQIFDRFFARWITLVQTDDGILFSSVIVDLKNASQAYEEIASAPERLASGFSPESVNQERLAGEINAGFDAVVQFYTNAVRRLSDLEGIRGDSNIAISYSSESLPFQVNADLFDYISTRCTRALEIIGASPLTVNEEGWAELIAIKSELFDLYGSAAPLR